MIARLKRGVKQFRHADLDVCIGGGRNAYERHRCFKRVTRNITVSETVGCAVVADVDSRVGPGPASDSVCAA